MLKAVIVNDDKSQLKKLSDLVSREGLTPETYISAETALSNMDKNNPPTVIITSLYMQGMDGWRFCRLLHSPEYPFFNKIPIMVVSASLAGSEPGIIAGDLGVEAYLPTPLDSSHFKESITLILDGKSSRRSKRFLVAGNNKQSELILFLTNNGYLVDSVSTVKASYENIKNKKYDLAILDYYLSDGKAEEILDYITSDQPECICIMIAEDPDPDFPLEWLKRGGYASIQKPFAHDYLLELCTRARQTRSLLRTQKILEERTREVAERTDFLKTILDTTQDGLWIIGEDGKVLESNDAYCRMSGYTLDELKKLSISDLELSEYAEKTTDRLKSIIKNKSKLIESKHKRKNNTVFDVEISITWVGKDINNFICFIRDITERKQAEMERQAAIDQQNQLQLQLNNTQKMESVGRLAGGIAHDFNNMMSVILGYTELMLEEVDPSAPVYTYLNEIRNAGEHSADLTRQLLAFARKQTVVAKVIDLNNTVEATLNMLRHLIGENINLQWLPGEGLGLLKMDPSQVGQILTNLCLNARDAVECHGNVEIKTGIEIFDQKHCDNNPGYLPGEYNYLAVSDDGCGIDIDELDKLFDPFYTTKETGKGTGLGLSIVHGIVKQNNGHVAVSSIKGQGSELKIYLPKYYGKAEQLKNEKISKVRGNETILLVEDESAILDMIVRMLKQIGYTVLPAVTPEEALGISTGYDGKIDLLMTDVVMPKMNGQELAEVIVETHHGIKKLFMSGYTADIIAKNGLINERINFIQKPFSFKSLSEKIRSVLDGE